MTADTTPRILPATLTAEDYHGGRQVQLACAHAETGAIVPLGALADAEIVRTVLLAHWLTEGCTCPRDLWRRYGMERNFEAAIAGPKGGDL